MSSTNSVLDLRLSIADIDAAIQWRRQHRILDYYPDKGSLAREKYVKHMAYFAAGGKHEPVEGACPEGCSGEPHRERLFLAANRVGKTEGVGAYELTLHLTGDYPKWWPGRRFDRPITAWVAGQTNSTTRDILQSKLLGRMVRQPGDSPNEAIGLGTGMIPADTIITMRPKAGIPNAIETVWVRHVSGGASTLVFKSYEQGVEAFMGTEIDCVWFDEEPPEDVYFEGLVRTMQTSRFGGGLVMVTFTPLMGWTNVVRRYLDDAERKAGHRFVVQAGWDDAPHLSESEKADMASKLPPHQRDARSKGIPSLGSGAIYPVEESNLIVEPFDIPETWPRGFAMDVGWNRTAAVWGALDRDNDTLYIYSEYLRGDAEPSVHAAAIRARGEWIPGVIDPAARGRSQVDGRSLMEMYQQLGLKLEPAENAVEAGIYEVWMRMCSGRLKVFKNLNQWLEELRQYHRDDKGRIVKQNDHLMDCTRYLCMSLDRMSAKPQAKTPVMVMAYPHEASWMN